MKTKYISVWVSETETWHYFIDTFDERQFGATGFVAYETIVDKNGIIIEDSYNHQRKGKKFDSISASWLGN